MSQKDNNTKKTQCIVGTVVILRLPHGSTEYDNDFLPQRGKEKIKNKNLRIISWINKTNQVAEEGGTISVHQVESGQRDGTWMKTQMFCFLCTAAIY